jgi:hypothetical protein
LPPGLTLSTDGTISGTPTGISSFSYIFTVADSSAPMKTANLLIPLVVAPELLITTVSVPDAHINAPYDVVLEASGSAVAAWSISSGQMPPGMQLVNPTATGAEILGTTTQTGTYTFTLEAKSLNLPPQVVTRAYTMVVDSKAAIATSQLPDIIRTASYSASLAAVNGTPPYHFTAQTALPSGLSLSDTGQLSGTTNFPQASFPAPFQVMDSAPTPTSSSRTIAIKFVDRLTLPTLFIPPAIVNKFYGMMLFANGGRTPYTWSVFSGSLPPGLSLVPDTGYINGVPTRLGTFTFNVQVQDSTNPAQAAVTSVTIQVVPPPLVMQGSLPRRIPRGVAFDGFIDVMGGTPPYSWSISSGALPAGLQLNTSTGEVSGTPNTLGHSDFIARTTDSSSPVQTAQYPYGVDVVVPLGRNNSIQKANLLGNGPHNASISPFGDPSDITDPDVDYYRVIADQSTVLTLEVFAKRISDNPLDPVIEVQDGNGVRLQTCNAPSNPTGPFTSACLNDDIQDGVERDSRLSVRLPGTSGNTQNIYVRVFDWGGNARPDMTYMLSVDGAVEPLTITQQVMMSGRVGSPYSWQLTKNGGYAQAATWQVTAGAMPPGLTLSAAGVISGTATTSGTYNFTVTVTDGAHPPQSASASFSIVIDP